MALDEPSINENHLELQRLGYLPKMGFNKVLEIALKKRSLSRSDLYVTQAFHLIPPARSYAPSIAELDYSFQNITVHELEGRKVLALGDDAADACYRAGIPHLRACHPSARRRTHEDKAEEIARQLVLPGY